VRFFGFQIGFAKVVDQLLEGAAKSLGTMEATVADASKTVSNKAAAENVGSLVSLKQAEEAAGAALVARKAAFAVKVAILKASIA
jgi:hypothetical protein